jgi:hypothetical protein
LTSLVATTLFMAYLWVLSLALRRDSGALSLLAGLVLAASLLTRPTMALAGLVPLALGLSVAMRPRLRSSLLAVGGLALGMAPWFVRNYVVLRSTAPIGGRSETILQGVDPYFRKHDWRAIGGPSGKQYYELVTQGKTRASKGTFALLKVRQAWAENPWEVLGWFTVGKLQYIVFTNPPSADNLTAIDSILRSFLASVGLLGALLSLRMRDLLPTAAMVAGWFALNVLIVPDPRYWLDVFPLLAVLAGGVVAALLEAAAPEAETAEAA